MKINGKNPSVDLIARMQEAHKTEKSKSSKTFNISEVGSATPAEDASGATSLDGQLRITAQKALKGAFNDDKELRLEVISKIVDERFDGVLTKRTEKTKLLKGLEATLLSDPEFGNQIDDMMMLAAKELGKQ